MAWRSAAWVLGGVRLISSASRISVKMGPLVRTNWLVWKLKRLVPSTSPGMRSGVNWMRPKRSESVVAKHWASSVLAVPGTPSSRMCPPASRLVSIMSMAASWPTMALWTSALISSVKLRVWSRFTKQLLSPVPDSLRGGGVPRRARRVGALSHGTDGVADEFFAVAGRQIGDAAGLGEQARSGVDEAALTGFDGHRQGRGRPEARRGPPAQQRGHQRHLQRHEVEWK